MVEGRQSEFGIYLSIFSWEFAMAQHSSIFKTAKQINKETKILMKKTTFYTSIFFCTACTEQ